MLSRPRGVGASALLCAVLFAAAMAAGCGLSGSAPAVSNVWPSTIVPGRTRTLLIAGQGFQQGATATLGGTIALPGVVWVNGQYLTASVPADLGLAGSQYSVVVTNPDQQQAVSAQPIAIGGLPTATATPAPTKTALPTATRERPTPTRTPVVPTPAPTPTPTETATAGPPIVIVVPPLTPPPSPVPTTTPSFIPTPVATLRPTQTPPAPSPRGPSGAMFAPFAPDRPIQPALPGRRSPR